MPDYDYDEFARSPEFEDDNTFSQPSSMAADGGTNYNSQGAQDNVETNWD